MKRINSFLDGLLFWFVSLSLTGVIVICFSQVVARYVFNAPFTWAEEVSIVFLLWATWTGACLAIKHGSHIRIQIVEERLAPSTRTMVRLVTSGLAVAFLLIVAWTSRELLEANRFMTLFSLPEVPRNVLNYSVTVGCILMAYYIVRSMTHEWTHRTGR